MYKIAYYNGVPACVVKPDDGMIHNIPFDEGNIDYQEYLAWLAEGNTPEPWEETNGAV